jgi:hypothetical protein
MFMNLFRWFAKRRAERIKASYLRGRAYGEKVVAQRDYDAVLACWAASSGEFNQSAREYAFDKGVRDALRAYGYKDPGE